MPIPALAVGAGIAAGYAGASLLSSSIGNKKTYKYSKKLMAYQNELNLENWRLQNEYNLPINEKNRWLSAGINPYFGIGTNQAGAVASPSAQMQAQAPDFAGAISAGIQATQMQAQTENIKEDTRGKQIQNDIAEEYGALGADANLRKTLQEVSNLIKDGKFTEARTKTENALRAPQVANMNSSTHLNYTNADKVAEETKYVGPYYELQERSVGVSEKQQAAEEAHLIRMDRFNERVADASVRKMDSETRYYTIKSAMEEFLYESGYFAKNYALGIDLIASNIAKNYSEIEHAGLPVGQVLGNLLNGLVGNSNEFFKNFVDYWFGDTSNKSIIGFFKKLIGVPESTPVRPKRGRRKPSESNPLPQKPNYQSNADPNHYGSGF